MIPKCDFRAYFINGHYRCLHNRMYNKYVPSFACNGCPLAASDQKSTTLDQSCPDEPQNIELYNIKFTNLILQEIETTSNTNDPGPTLDQQAINLLDAVDAFISDGYHFVQKEEYVARLLKCQDCPLRNMKKCTHNGCGCDITAKAMLASSHCPKQNPEW